MVMTNVKRTSQWAQEVHINWELNDRISLSSAGSVHNEPSSTVRSRADSNASNLNSNLSKPIGRRSTVIEKIDADPGTPVQRRWNATKSHLDRTNDALAQRLSVIQELNRKILASRDTCRSSLQRSYKPDTSTIGKSRSRRSSLVAERREALGEKLHFQRRAGGEWSLPEEKQPVQQPICTLQRSARERSPPQEQPSGASSPISWRVDEDDPERSVLRELNEAIDRFEEEDDRKKLAGGCHDSSGDSGVGAELLPAAAAAAAAAATTAGAGNGWLRVHTGIESSVVYLAGHATAADVCRDMLLSDCLALFVQCGGEQPSRRLSPGEKPLELQEQLLLKLGYREPARRARLGLDAELRHLIRFHIGPAAPLDSLRGYSRCGSALVLKGLVSPQWKKRPFAVVGSRLFYFPAYTSESRPEWVELGGGGSVCCAPSHLGKLVLRVTGFPSRVLGKGKDESRHLYLGFHHPWDRDLWRGWLKEASQSSSSSRLDMSETGTARLPEAVRCFQGVREFFLGHNQLARPDGNLRLLLSFPELQELHLEDNRLGEFPAELLELKNLTFLDLSDNGIHEVPPEIARLTSLQELILERNDIKELPAEIGELRQLRHISLAGNLIERPPSFLLEMRALALGDVLLPGRAAADAAAAAAAKATSEEKSNLHNSLYKVNLRNNQLKGNIILGNYGNLTHLDLSENSIEKLDLSALQELRSVRCARNVLTELTLCGRSLVSLIAGNNKLKKLTIVPVPANLEHLDVSYNELDSLPEWTPELPVLRALFASHNGLTALPDRLLSQPSQLEVLHLPHNRLQALPPPRRQLSLVHLTLQDNALTVLPVNFFANTLKMKVLNLSNNRLSELAYKCTEEQLGRNNRQDAASGGGGSSLEKLYLTGNSLTNTALDALAKFTALRVLHLAYNALDTLPESCIASWKELEELVLSGNKLQYLPDNVANLPHLRVLRVHSNRLLTCPAFNKTSSLKVLDLAHNRLHRLNLDNLLSAQLQFLDISCNSRLHVDPRQFQSYSSTRRPLSLVDVSGQSGAAGKSPAAATPRTLAKDSEQHHLPWRLGFSETAGTRERLLVSQIRMPTFYNVEGLFGLFDGGSNQEPPASLQETIPRLLLEERTIKETRNEYLRYTLLSAQRELRERGQKYGADAALVHITRLVDPEHQDLEERPRYLLTAATCGEARAVLCRASGPLQLAKAASAQYMPRLQAALAQAGRKNGAANLLPVALPEPISEEVVLEDDDEFVIIGNRHLWEVLSIQEAVREARAEANPVLAAKRLQDLGQAYGAEDNLSVIVVRLSTSKDVQPPLSKLLMRELRQAVHSKAEQQQQRSELTSNGTTCTCPCCVPRLPPHEDPNAVNGCYFNFVLRNLMNASNSSAKSSRSSQRLKDISQHQQQQQQQTREERSSPSGQSDQTSEVGLFEPRSRKRTSSRSTGSRFCSGSASACKLRQQQQQQQQAAVERTPPPSDEQLRCWEYMLEQNTQLLFDKELDTLTSVPAGSAALRRGGQSRSTPQLGSSSGVPFLSRRFGSARSFDNSGPLATLQPIVQPVPLLRSAFGGSGRRLLNGGPNAAYFGSLQRLMPYNLEYDFAVIQERGALDSLEQDASRMQQYWGVATTEL